MYISPFVLGILVTIFVEIVVIFGIAVYYSLKKRDKQS